MQDISKLQDKVRGNEVALDKISKKFNTLNESLEGLKGEHHVVRCKVVEIECNVNNYAKQIEDLYERLLSLERYSREYNFRFNNVAESPSEDCRQKIREILSNQLNIEPVIEHAHRIGPRSDNKPRTIICKFLYRPERLKVLQMKRDLQDGVWVTEHLSWEVREKKKKLKDVMKAAFESGKKPRFHRGKLYIDGAIYGNT